MKLENDLAAVKTQEVSATKVPGNKALSQEDFMKLFLTQMQAQDPMKPFNSGDMMQQMSQLNSLTSTQGLEKAIKTMNANLGNSQMLTATQLIGKDVLANSNVSSLTQAGLNGAVVLKERASSIDIDIRDQANNVIKKIVLPASNPGVVDFHWDGKLNAADEAPLPPGYYNISATANINNQNVALDTAGYFKVNSVTMDRQSSGVQLNLDGVGGRNMNQIIKILS